MKKQIDGLFWHWVDDDDVEKCRQYLGEYSPQVMLSLAAGCGSFGVAKMALENGADPNRKDSIKESFPLEQVSFLLNLDLIKLLKENGASQGMPSLLFSAAAAGRKDIVIYLEEQGVDLHQPDENGYGLTYHALYGTLEFLQYLVEERGFKPAPGDLIHAANDGKLEFLNYLLRYGLDPNFRDTSGNTALHRACFGGIEAVKAIVEAGGDLNAVTEDGKSVLHFACRPYRDNRYPLVTYLLEKGATIDLEHPSVPFA